MDADVLKATTLNETTRTLLQVQIDSILDTDKTLVELLGKDPAQRAAFIMESSEFASAEDLDVYDKEKRETTINTRQAHEKTCLDFFSCIFVISVSVCPMNGYSWLLPSNSSASSPAS